MSSYKSNISSCRILSNLQLYFYWVTEMKAEQIRKYKQLGLNISYYRKDRGMSQSQLAELIDISRTHMSRIETADCAVSLDIVFQICDVLKVSPVRLFDFRDEE